MLQVTFMQQMFYIIDVKVLVTSGEQFVCHRLGDYQQCSFLGLDTENQAFIGAYQGVRNVNFSENFADVLNEWSLDALSILNPRS